MCMQRYLSSQTFKLKWYIDIHFKKYCVSWNIVNKWVNCWAQCCLKYILFTYFLEQNKPLKIKRCYSLSVINKYLWSVSYLKVSTGWGSKCPSVSIEVFLSVSTHSLSPCGQEEEPWTRQRGTGHTARITEAHRAVELEKDRIHIVGRRKDKDTMGQCSGEMGNKIVQF